MKKDNELGRSLEPDVLWTRGRMNDEEWNDEGADFTLMADIMFAVILFITLLIGIAIGIWLS